MKKGIILVVIILIGVVVYISAAFGRSYGYRNVISTGVTGINFDKVTTEIYVANFSTNICYVNFVSSYVMTVVNTTNYFLLQRQSTTTAPDRHTEEVGSSWMSVFSSHTPVNIRIQWKMPQRP